LFLNHIYNSNRAEFLKCRRVVFQIKDLDTHRLIAHRQAASYKNNKLNLPENTLMIELDWKQKVLIGNKILYS